MTSWHSIDVMFQAPVKRIAIDRRLSFQVPQFQKVHRRMTKFYKMVDPKEAKSFGIKTNKTPPNLAG